MHDFTEITILPVVIPRKTFLDLTAKRFDLNSFIPYCVAKMISSYEAIPSDPRDFLAITSHMNRKLSSQLAYIYWTLN